MRWADLDLLGHVNNVVYVDYLQEARVDMLRTHAPDRGPASWPRASWWSGTRCTLRRPAGASGSEPVNIECWVTEIRAASFTMAYEVFDEDADGARTVYLRAKTLLTPYVFADGAAAPHHRRREGGARAVPRADEPLPTVRGAQPGRAPREPATTPCTCASPTSTSTATSTT